MINSNGIGGGVSGVSGSVSGSVNNKSSDNINIPDTCKAIDSILDVPVWNKRENSLFKQLRDDYVTNTDFILKNKICELIEDKKIIMNNIKDQLWYIKSVHKLIIDRIVNNMNMEKYVCYSLDDALINFYLQLSFGKFKLRASFYFNVINATTNSFISVCTADGKNDAYLTYFVKSIGLNESVNLKNMNIPEYDKIYYCTDMDKDLIGHMELVCIFSEIVLYYDKSGKIGDVPIGNNNPITLNEIINKINNELCKIYLKKQYVIDMSKTNKKLKDSLLMNPLKPTLKRVSWKDEDEDEKG